MKSVFFHKDGIKILYFFKIPKNYKFLRDNYSRITDAMKIYEKPQVGDYDMGAFLI